MPDENTQPVPKETPPAQATQVTQTPPVTTQQPVQPQQTQPKTKKKGFCNMTTCCIGSAAGCFLLIIVLVLLAIFAAPRLADILDRFVNPNVNVPEVSDVSTESLMTKVAEIEAGTGEQTIEVTEEEFNSLLAKQLEEGQSEYDLGVDTRVDFENDSAKMYMKLLDWMPWAVFEMTGDANGTTIITSVTLGPIDIGSYVDGQTTDSFLEEGSDASSMLAGYLFGSSSADIKVKETYFYQDKMEMVVVVYAAETAEPVE
ncbi:hypothetical protein ACFLY9_02595 [Patescibacteria group bacterium]